MILGVFKLIVGLGTVVFMVFTAVKWADETKRLREARNAGVDAACKKCGYPVKGWASTVCPECGTDTKVAGVRVAHRGLWPLWLLIATAAAMMTMNWVTPPIENRFRYGEFEYNRDFHSRAATDQEEYRTQALAGYTGGVIDCTAVLDRNGHWERGLLTLTLNGRAGQRAFDISEHDQIPSTSELVEALAEVAGQPTNMVDESIATELEAQLRWYFQVALHTGPHDIPRTTDLYQSMGGSGTISLSHVRITGQFLLIGIAITVFLAFFLPLWRLTRSRRS